jgi:hypothetical protein
MTSLDYTIDQNPQSCAPSCPMKVAVLGNQNGEVENILYNEKIFWKETTVTNSGLYRSAVGKIHLRHLRDFFEN